MRCSIPIFFVFLWIPIPTVAGPLGDAAKKGDIAEIDRLLALGSDANEPDTIASPLHWAAMHGHAEAVSLLAANGADLEVHSDMLGTPLHAAARFGREAAIKELLAAGLDPDVRDRNAFTPLMHAVMENRSAAVEALLAGGADVHAVGNAPGGRQIGAGPTIALQLAISFGRNEIADMLRAAGAGPSRPRFRPIRRRAEILHAAASWR